jgi:hypothetical protein
MVRFVGRKCKLFGANELTKDVTLDNLDPDDIAALERDFHQVCLRDSDIDKKHR